MHHKLPTMVLASLFVFLPCFADDVVKPKRLLPPTEVEDDAKQIDPSVPISKLAIQASALSNKTAGLEVVPDKITIPSTKRFQIVTAKASGKVKWMVFNKANEPVEWLEIPGTKSIQVFPNYGKDDVITVYVYTAVDGAPSDPVKSTIVVGKEETKKAPTGDVDNDKDKKGDKKIDGQLHFTIITDADLAKANAPLDTLINGKDLRAGVENRGHKLWIMDQKKDAERIKDAKLDDYLRKVGKVPMYVIQDAEGTVLDSAQLPLTIVTIVGKLDALSKTK